MQDPIEQTHRLSREQRAFPNAAEWRHIQADILKATHMTTYLLSALGAVFEDEREQIAEAALGFAVKTLRRDPLERLLEHVRQEHAAANESRGSDEGLF